jgi:hypothetical protein
MSDNWLILIPTDPPYLPDTKAQHKALKVYKSFVSDESEVNINVTDAVVFVDPGTNLERILCPICHTTIDLDWWKEAMKAASGADPDIEWEDLEKEPEFENLIITTPCCGNITSLNDLQYDWPAGFARFALEALYPDISDLTDQQMGVLERILNCKLRKIWAHY